MEANVRDCWSGLVSSPLPNYWWNLLGEMAWLWVRPGWLLRQTRKRQGLTMGDVALATKLPVHVISDAERGRRKPHPRVRQLLDYWR